MIKIFSLSLNLNLLWSSIIFTVLLRGVIILSVVDFRIVLVLSSIGNNSWFLLSQISNTFIFLFFILMYSISLYYVLIIFNSLSKFNFVSSSYTFSYKLSFWVLSLSGIPPFPVFYGKILVILRFLLSLNFNYHFFLFLVFNALIVIGYLQSIIKFFIFVYSSCSHYLVKY
jgi:NADH-quinone oxidoreductase subunit N